MSTRTLPPGKDDPAPSSWRLVNLALGLAAVLSFAGIFGLVPYLTPSDWILAPSLTAGGVESVPRTILVIALIGIKVWLPASALMMVFALVGLHRKLAAPRFRLASAALTLAWVFDMALDVAVIIFADRFGGHEAAGAIMIVAGFYVVPVRFLFMCGAIAAAIAELMALFRYKASAPSRVPLPLLGWAFVPPVLSVIPLLLAPNNPLALSARENSDYEAACKNVGVRLIAKPIAPVNSIAYDWDPQRISGRPWMDHIELDDNGRIQSFNAGISPINENARIKPNFDFTEYRGDPLDSGHRDAAYVRVPRQQLPQPVETLSADLLAVLDADKPDELRKAPKRQGTIRFQLTLSDRRSGTVLGVQTYVVDQINHRACGANAGNLISHSAFVYDAIHLGESRPK